VLRFIVLTFLLVSLGAGELIPVEPLDSKYSRADLVCRGEVTSVAPGSPEGTTNRSGGLIPIDYYATFLVDRCYKGDSQSNVLTLRFPGRDQATGAPTRVGAYLLVFLKETGSTNEIVSAPIPFWKVASGVPSSQDGFRQLEHDLVSVAVGADSDSARSALAQLAEIGNLSQETYDALDALTRSGDKDVSLTSSFVRARAAMALRKTSLHRPVDDLAELTGAIRGRETLPVPITIYMEDLLQDATVEDLPTLEELSNHPIGSIRHDAMAAIRNLQDATTIPFLIGQLDSHDSEVCYDAVVTLAEITGKSGSYGPAIDAFEKNPDMYRNLWKQWWIDQGSRQ
jgi:hypothetical protein